MLIDYLRPWKLGTFALGMAWLFWGALHEGAADWDLGIGVIMGTLTYLTAPVAARILMTRQTRRIPLALACYWLSVDGCYWAYWQLVNPDALVLREANFHASSCLYWLCGFIWLHRGPLRDLLKEDRGVAWRRPRPPTDRGRSVHRAHTIADLRSHAARLLAPGERLRYATRPRFLRLPLLLALGAILVALGVFSIIVEPGFFRLAILPGLPVAGALAASLLHAPVILVTDRRLVFARRGMAAPVIDLAGLKGFRIRESALERAVGFGALDLLVQPAQDPGKGVFLSYLVAPLPDARGLASALAGDPDGSRSPAVPGGTKEAVAGRAAIPFQ